MYYAIIGDIVDSKKIKNRLEMQEKLKEFLNKINNDYDDSIASKFIITLGDEFQGLLENPVKMFEIINKIELYMKPIKFRFGIGVGNILTNIDEKMSIGSDGPVWWNARNMISELKYLKKGVKQISNIKISGIKNQNVLDLININLCLCHSIKNNWTNEQRKVIEHIVLQYGLSDNFVQKHIALELGMSPENLNKKLKLSLYYDYVYSQKTIAKILETER